MSLTACPECSRQISTAAFACPGCGHPAPAAALPPRPRRIDWLVPAIAVGGVLTSLATGRLAWMGIEAYQDHQAAAAHAYVERPTNCFPELAPPYVPLPPPPPVVKFAVEQSPRILNMREVSRTLSRVYPPQLRDAGVPGHVVARFQVTEHGMVDPGTIGIEAATHDAFSAAAVRVIERMRFEPAQFDGRPVSIWMTVPITFALPR